MSPDILENIKNNIEDNKTILFINPFNNNDITNQINLYSETIKKEDKIKQLSFLKKNTFNINILAYLTDSEIANLVATHLFLEDDFYISIIYVRVVLVLNAISFLSKKYDNKFLIENNLPNRESITLLILNKLLDKQILVNLIDLIEKTEIEEKEIEYVNNHLLFMLKSIINTSNKLSFYDKFIESKQQLIRNFLLLDNTIFSNDKTNKNLTNYIEENKDYIFILETNILNKEGISSVSISYILNLINTLYKREKKCLTELYIFINDKDSLLKYESIKNCLEDLSTYKNIHIF